MSYLTEEEARMENFPTLKVALKDEIETEIGEKGFTQPKTPEVIIANEKKTGKVVSESIDDSSLSEGSSSTKEPKKKILLETISTVYEDLQKTNEELESLNKNLFSYINKMIDTQKNLAMEDSKSSVNDEASKSSCIDETLNGNSSDKIVPNFPENEKHKRKIDDESESKSQYCTHVIDSSDVVSQLDITVTDVSRNFVGSNFAEVTVLSPVNDLQRTSINHDNLTTVVVHRTSDHKEQTADVRKVFIREDSNTSSCSQSNYTDYSYPSYHGNIPSYAVTESYPEPNTSAILTSRDRYTNLGHYSTFEDHSRHSPEYYARTSHSYIVTRQDGHYVQNRDRTADKIAHQCSNDGNFDAVCSDENEGKHEQFIVDTNSHANMNMSDPTERQGTDGKSDEYSKRKRTFNDPTESQETGGKSDHSAKRKKISDRSGEFVQDSVAQNIIKRYGEYKRNITDKSKGSDTFVPNVLDNNQEDSNEKDERPPKAEVVKDPSGPLSRSKFTYGEYRRNLAAKTLGKTSDVKDPISGSSATMTPNERRGEQPNLSSNVGKSHSNYYIDSKRMERNTSIRNRDDDLRYTYSANPRRDSQSSDNMEMVNSEDEITETSFTQGTYSQIFSELRSVLDSADPDEIMPWYLPKRNISLVDDKKESEDNKRDGSRTTEQKERKSNVSDQTSDIPMSDKRKDSTVNLSLKSDGTKSCERKESKTSSAQQRVDVEMVCDRKESKSNYSWLKIDASKLNEPKEVKGSTSDKSWDPTKSRYSQRPGRDDLSDLGERSFNPFSPFSPNLSTYKPEVDKSEKQNLVRTSSQKLAVKERDPAEILSAILANREKDKDRGKSRHLKKPSSSHKKKVSTETSKKESSVSKSDTLPVISEPVVSSTNDFINSDLSLEGKDNITPDNKVAPDSSTNLIETVSAIKKEHEDILSEEVPSGIPVYGKSQDIDGFDTKESFKTCSDENVDYHTLSEPNLSASLSNAVEEKLTDTYIKMSVLNEKRICEVKLVDIFWKAKRDGKLKKKRIDRLIEKVVKKCLRREKSILRLVSEKTNNPGISNIVAEINSKFDEAQGEIKKESNSEGNNWPSGDTHEIRTKGSGNTKKRKRLISDDNEDEVVNEESGLEVLQSIVSDSCKLTEKLEQNYPLSVDSKQKVTEESSFNDSKVMCPVSHETFDHVSEVNFSKQKVKEESSFDDSKVVSPVSHETSDHVSEGEKTDNKFIQCVGDSSESKSEIALKSNATIKDSDDTGKVSSCLKDNEVSGEICGKSSEEIVPITSLSNKIPSKLAIISSLKEEDKGNYYDECNLKEELVNLPGVGEDDPAPISADSNNERVQPVTTDLRVTERVGGGAIQVCVEDHSEEISSDTQINTVLKSVSDSLNVQSENSGISHLSEDTSSSSLTLPIIENVANEINKSLLEIDSTPNTLIEASSDSSGEEEFPFLKNLDSFLTDLSKISKIGESMSSACDSSQEISKTEEVKIDIVKSECDSNERNPVSSSSIVETNAIASEKYDSPDVKGEIKLTSNEEQSTISHSKQVEVAPSFCAKFAQSSDSNLKDEVRRSGNNSEEEDTSDISSTKEENTSNHEKYDCIDINEKSMSVLSNNESKNISTCLTAQLEVERVTFSSSEDAPRLDDDLKEKVGSSFGNSEEINLTDSSSISCLNIASLAIGSHLGIKEKGNSVPLKEDIDKSVDSAVDRTEDNNLDVPENFVENSVFSDLVKSNTDEGEEVNSHDQVLNKSVTVIEQQEIYEVQNVEKNTTEVLVGLCKEENVSSSEVLETRIKIEESLTGNNEKYSEVERPKLEKNLKKVKAKSSETTTAVNIDKKESKDPISASENVKFRNKEKRDVERRKIGKDLKKKNKKKVQEDTSGTDTKKFAEGEKKSVSDEQKNKPMKVIVKTTEKSKSEKSGVKHSKKDLNPVKVRHDGTKSSKPSSISSEAVQRECSSSEKKSLSGNDQKSESMETIAKTAERSKYEPSVKHSKKDPNRVKVSLDGTESSKPSSVSSDAVQRESSSSEKKSLSGNDQKSEFMETIAKTAEKSKYEPSVKHSKKDPNRVKVSLDGTESSKPSSVSSEAVQHESSSSEKKSLSGDYKKSESMETIAKTTEKSKREPGVKHSKKDANRVKVKRDSTESSKPSSVISKILDCGSSSSEKKPLSSDDQKSESMKTFVEKTEKSKYKPGDKHSKKDTNRVKVKLDSTESSKPSSSISEPLEHESSIIADKGCKKMVHSIINDEELEDDSKKKINKSSKSERKDKNRDTHNQVSSSGEKSTTVFEKIESPRDSDKESDSSNTKDIDKDRKSRHRESPERNPQIDEQSLEKSPTSHSIDSERKYLSDVEDKDEHEEGHPSEDKPETIEKSSKCTNVFKCIVCKNNYCTDKKEGVRLGNYSKRIAAFCQNCFIDMYKTNYDSLITNLRRKKRTKES